jgi:hypothetical protein
MRNVIAFLDSLVKEADQLENLAVKPATLQREEAFARRYRRWQKSTIEIMEYASLPQHASEARKILHEKHWSDYSKVTDVAGLIESARDLVANGFVGQMKFLLHAEVFATMIEQAKALLDAGHLIPSAVLGRIVMENWLKDQAERAGIEVPESAKASGINDSLKKAEVFSVPKWRQVQAYLDVGNAAAHGQAESFSREDVARLLDFAEVNCV